MEIDFGVDISCYPDYDPLGTMVSGVVALGQRIARRITNLRGAWFWSPNDCTDVRSNLNATITSSRQSDIKSDIERECLNEEVVSTVNADVSVSPLSTLGQTITIHITGTTATNKTFKYIMAVTDVTLAILLSS